MPTSFYWPLTIIGTLVAFLFLGQAVETFISAVEFYKEKEKALAYLGFTLVCFCSFLGAVLLYIVVNSTKLF
jgi:uncharacterized BrkB/YihY/UPF0761 family membrane protein